MYPKMNLSQSHGTFVAPAPRRACPTSAGRRLSRSGHTPSHSCNTDVYAKWGTLSTNITITANSVQQLTAKTNATGWTFWTKWKLTVLIPVPLGTHFNWLRGVVSRSTLWSCFVSPRKGGGDAFVAWGESSWSPSGQPLSPTGSADVICQTKTYIYTGSKDEIRGPKAGLSAAITGEEPSQLSFPFSPCVLQPCCSVRLQQICVMTSEGDWGLATVAQRRPNRKPNWWLSQVNYIANFHILPALL